MATELNLVHTSISLWTYLHLHPHLWPAKSSLPGCMAPMHSMSCVFTSRAQWFLLCGQFCASLAVLVERPRPTPYTLLSGTSASFHRRAGDRDVPPTHTHILSAEASTAGMGLRPSLCQPIFSPVPPPL